MRDDMKFRMSDQWNKADRDAREADGRPCLTINRIPQFIRQITNQFRSNRPGIQVNPVDSIADPKTANALQGVIRHIETISDADVAYATANEHQATIGRGFWRIYTRYADDEGFDQEIVIEAIDDPFSVYLDPAHRLVSGADCRYGFVVYDMPKDDFISEYGEQELSGFEAWIGSNKDSKTLWMPEGAVRVAEYFHIERVDEEIQEVSFIDDNDVPHKVVMPTSALRSKDGEDLEIPDHWKLGRKRTVSRPQCYWSKITPNAILDGNSNKTGGRKFPCKFIPIVQALGDKLYDDKGEVDIRGMVRDAKDPARMISFWASALTEMIGLAPRAPYIGLAGQFKGHEAKWNSSNRKNYPYLEVEPLTIGGNPAPFPQRQQYEPAIQAIVQAFMLADNDLKAVMGLYDASLGKAGPEQSGKAILARQRQGEVGNSNYLDNMNRAIRHCGRILLDMIPRTIGPEKVYRILGADNNEIQLVKLVNGPQAQPQPGIEQQPPQPGMGQEAPQPGMQQAPPPAQVAPTNPPDRATIEEAEGVPAIYDISTGKFDVAISTGPSYAGRRQEAVQAMIELLGAYSEAGPAIMDLIVKNMDWPGASEVAARLKRMVPPQLLDESERGQVPPQIPPEVTEELDKLRQEVVELRTNKEVKMAEAQGKLELARQKLEIDTQVKAAELQFQQTMQQIQQQAQAQQQEIARRVEGEIEKVIARMKIDSEERMRQKEIDSEERIAQADRESEEEIAEKEIKSDEKVAKLETEKQAEIDKAKIRAQERVAKEKAKQKPSSDK